MAMRSSEELEKTIDVIYKKLINPNTDSQQRKYLIGMATALQWVSGEDVPDNTITVFMREHETRKRYSKG